MNIEVATPIIVALIAGPLGAVVTFFFTKDSRRAESQLAITTGASHAVEAITNVLDQLREELDQTKDELVRTTEALTEMRKQNERLIKENKELVQRLEELKNMVEKLSADKNLDNNSPLV